MIPRFCVDQEYIMYKLLQSFAQVLMLELSFIFNVYLPHLSAPEFDDGQILPFHANMTGSTGK